ncbi:glucose-fructose oxidoreductase [Edaphobacter acidisoli]|uniref:Glucose-fructose oxidoreductase n=1 Tax=Edaphobacter acidisoli TaxID=2040573 RepID=A0A916W2U7_9BACT|nr:Gfo/Idh/MocA family oxidoreductase [Edaphobacter acidisoli]GGA62182.1 glucose-fructose oxidoreductase [Edaphobacter acidisoli]
MNLSRRDFSKLGAMGLASRMLPEGFGQTSSRKIGYCVIGIGRIADHFLRGVQESSHSKITGFVSGHRDKAERFAAQYGVPKDSIYNYEDMDRMIDNKQIDAVYVALPNNMHAEYTIRSAKAGKHVLCEKPMSTTVADAEAMIAACKSANVKLMIAYRLHYEPFNLKAIQMIRNGDIGEVQTINGAFGFNSPQGEWRLTKKYGGGGSLFDVGIYVVNACRYLTGEEPASFTGITSTLDHDGRFNEVEENVSWTMKFPSGILATGSSTYGTQMPGYFKVFGTKGWLGMNPAYNYDGLRLQANYWKTPGSPLVKIDEINPERDPKQFAREADHMSECILNNRTPSSPGEEGLRDMRYIKAIYHAAGVDVA